MSCQTPDFVLAALVAILAVLQIRESRAAARRQKWREQTEEARRAREVALRDALEEAATLMRPDSLRAFFAEAAKANAEAARAHQRIDGHEVRLNDLTGRVGRLEEDSRG